MNMTIIVIGWIALGLYCHGAMFAYFQNKWPTLAKDTYWDDLWIGLGLSMVFPPATLVVVLQDRETRRLVYGFKLW